MVFSGNAFSSFFTYILEKKIQIKTLDFNRTFTSGGNLVRFIFPKIAEVRRGFGVNKVYN